MTQRGWTMGMVTIMPTIVTKPAILPTVTQQDSFNSVQAEVEESRFEELESDPVLSKTASSVQHWQHTPTTVQLDSFNSIQT